MGAKSGRNKRGAKKSAAPKAAGGSGGPNGAQRLGLGLFAVAFVALFVIFAVSDGLGAPSVPSDDVALVSGVSGDGGHVSDADYMKSVEQQSAQAGLKKPPKAGSKKAEEVEKAALLEVLQAVWIGAESEELGLKVTPKEVEAELSKIKEESFKTEKAFQEFLKESHLDEDEANELIELQTLSKKIKEKISKEAPAATVAEQESYYDEEKATQFTKKPTRDVRVVVNEDKKEVEAAEEALKGDQSEKNWEKVTKKYSPNTSSTGGLQKEISEEFLVGQLKSAVFKSDEGELVGPVKQEKNYILLEVVKSHPEEVQPFSKVKTTIQATLQGQREESFFAEWVAGFQTKWTSRTHCAADHVTEQCANYAGNGRPSTANPACYEVDPKEEPTECPAPVTATSPAVPGSVTLKAPKGEQKPQGPLPYTPPEAKGAKGATGTEGAEAAPGATGSKAEQEAAAQKAVEEAAAKAAAEAGSSGSQAGE